MTAIEIQVRAVEEPYLLRTHGQTYRDACQVSRFLPHVGRLSGPGVLWGAFNFLHFRTPPGCGIVPVARFFSGELEHTVEV